MRNFLNILMLIILVLNTHFFDAENTKGAQSTINWQPWSGPIFEQAKREHKLVVWI